MGKEDIHSTGIQSRLILNDGIENLDFVLVWSAIESVTRCRMGKKSVSGRSI